MHVLTGALPQVSRQAGQGKKELSQSSPGIPLAHARLTLYLPVGPCAALTEEVFI